MSLHRKSRLPTTNLSRFSTLHGALQEFELPNRRRLNIASQNASGKAESRWLSTITNGSGNQDVPDFIKFDHTYKNGQGMNVTFILEHARCGDLAQWMAGPYDQVFNADVPAGSTVPLEIMWAGYTGGALGDWQRPIKTTSNLCTGRPITRVELASQLADQIDKFYKYHVYHNPRYTGATPDLKLGPGYIVLDRLVLVGFHRVHSSNVRWRLDLAYDYYK